MWILTIHESTGEAVSHHVRTLVEVGEHLADWAEEREEGTVLAVTLRWEP